MSEPAGEEVVTAHIVLDEAESPLSTVPDSTGDGDSIAQSEAFVEQSHVQEEPSDEGHLPEQSSRVEPSAVDFAATIQRIEEEFCNILNAEADTGLSRVSELLSPLVDAQPSELLQKVDWNKKSQSGETLLWWMASKGALNWVQRLLVFPGVDVNALVRETTPLMIAAKNGHAEVVQTLLDAPNVQANIKDETGASALWYAVENGHESIATMLLERRPEVDPMEENTEVGETAFFRACQAGWLSVVELILGRGADVVAYLINRTAKREKMTPLHAAAKHGHVAVTKRLLAAEEINVNAFTSSGITPLIHALVARHVQVAEALLEHPKLDVNKPTPTRVTPLYLAASQGYPEMVDLLLRTRHTTKLNVNEDGIGETALYAAVTKKFLAIVNALLSCEEIDPNQADGTLGLTPLFAACEMGLDEIAKALLAHPKIEVNAARRMDGVTPLITSIQLGHTNVALEMLNHPKIDPNQRALFGKGGSPLWVASLRGDLAVLKRLLDLRADMEPTVQGADAFWIACQENHDNIVRELLNRRAEGQIKFDVNKLNDRGASAIYVACTRGNLPVIKTLLTACPELDISTKVGQNTVLVDAVVRNNVGVVEILCQLRGSDVSRIVNVKMEDGKTALWLACSKNQINIVEYLCRVDGVDPNIPATQPRFTALHIAAAQGHAETVALLLDSYDEGIIDLDINARDAEGHTALHLAMILAKKEIVQLLLYHDEVIVDRFTAKTAEEVSNEVLSDEDHKLLLSKYRKHARSAAARGPTASASRSKAPEPQTGGISTSLIAAGGVALAAAVLLPWLFQSFVGKPAARD